MATILTPSFSEVEIIETLKADPDRAKRLVRNKAETITLEELEKLGPNFKKRPRPASLLRGRPPKYGRKPNPDLPLNCDSLMITILSRKPPEVLIEYKDRQANFKTLSTLRSSQTMLKELFYSSDLVNEDIPLVEKKKSRYWRSAASLHEAANSDLKKLRRLFGEEFLKFRKLALEEKRTIENIYGVQVIKGIDYAKESIVDNINRSNRIIPSNIEYDYSYERFKGTDLQLIKMLKTVDYYYYQIKSPNEIRYYTHSGSFIALTNLKSSFIVKYKKTPPIDRPLIILGTGGSSMYYPVFADSFLRVIEDGKENLVLTKEGGQVVTTTSKEVILKGAENPSYNYKSKLYKPGLFIRDGQLKVLAF